MYFSCEESEWGVIFLSRLENVHASYESRVLKIFGGTQKEDLKMILKLHMVELKILTETMEKNHRNKIVIYLSLINNFHI